MKQTVKNIHSGSGAYKKRDITDITTAGGEHQLTVWSFQGHNHANVTLKRDSLYSTRIKIGGISRTSSKSEGRLRAAQASPKEKSLLVGAPQDTIQ